MSGYNTIVVGGGPAGLAAALSVAKQNKRVLIIEREQRLGGILKQCIHDGFGVIKFGEKLSGTEYAERYIDNVLKQKNIEVKLLTFVTNIKKMNTSFILQTTSRDGLINYDCDNIIFANGCRERTPRQVNIHGTRPSGVMTAGVCQNYVNLQGVMPTKRCVILGSGDIGLIMARRLTLEGATVVGVYEAKKTPSGLTRNISQCLNDFDIPLYLSKTVTKVFGEERVTAVEISAVNEKMQPIIGTEEIIECDALIVSVGLIPENELAEKINIAMDAATKGAMVDQNLMTSVDNVYSVGNALFVHDLVDYVSDGAEIAGKHSAEKHHPRQLETIKTKGFSYVVPQTIDINSDSHATTMYFRTAEERKKALFTVRVGGTEVYKKVFTNLKPAEMERVVVPISPKQGDSIIIKLEGVSNE